MSWKQTASAQRMLEHEIGTIHKDWGGRLPIALVFPNTYHVGMSNLAVHTLYRLWNCLDEIVCERVFAHPDAAPLSLESAARLDYFPVVAFSISYEMDYFALVAMLRAAGIPPRASARDESHPLLIGGGPAVSANPEPLAPILDAAVIGEVEPISDALTAALGRIAESRDSALDALAQLPGLYVPSRAQEGESVARQWLRDMDSVPTYSVISTPHTEFGSRSLIEISRGCGRACRFCLAGYAFRPPRHRSVDAILAQAEELLRGGNRLGLVSAAVSDHPQIGTLAEELRRRDAQLSISSMRVDPVSEPLLHALAASNVRTLTIAPEAGSERLRQVINKTQTEDHVLHATNLAAQLGFEQLKLYFMLGLPSEEQSDVDALINLAKACADRFPRQVTVNITPFVPKPHTPFQRMAQTPAKIVKRRLAYVERRLRRAGIGVKAESPAWAEIQGALARGDRLLADALLVTERVTPATWRQSLSAAGLSASDLLGERPKEETLPWGFLDTRVRPARSHS
jgi:radical SAM superfamily enzyme YgiQ (UPF0313 family)